MNKLINGDIQHRFDMLVEILGKKIRLNINEGRNSQNLSNQNTLGLQRKSINFNPKQNALRFSFEKINGNKNSVIPTMNPLKEPN